MEARKPDSIAQLRSELQERLSQPQRWTDVPALLDRLDACRRAGTPAPASALLWVDSFAGELAQVQPRVDAESAQRTARELMPWLGVYDPVALARGSWVDLPKSYT